MNCLKKKEGISEDMINFLENIVYFLCRFVTGWCSVSLSAGQTCQTAAALLTGPLKTAALAPTQTQTCKMSGDKPSPCAGCMRVLILLLYSKLSSLCLMPNRKAL